MEHSGHCLDFLRQQLMCTADVGLVSFVWVKSQNGPVADLSTKHRCRDFEAIRDWASERQVTGELAEVKPVTRPGDRLNDYP